MKFTYLVNVELAPQDEDLKARVPAIIRDRFEGTAVKIPFIGGPLPEDQPSLTSLEGREARFLLDCISYFRDNPAFRERYTEMTFTLASKLAPIANQEAGQ